MGTLENNISFARFMDIDIPMLEKYKNEKGEVTATSVEEATIKKYTEIMEKGNPIQFVVETVGADGSLKQNLHGVDMIMPPDQLYEQRTLTPHDAKEAIGRHYTAMVTEIKDGVIYVSRVRAAIGDGSIKERVNRRIRAVVSEGQRAINPFLEGLRAQAEEDGKRYVESYRAKGEELRENQIRIYVKNRYDELLEAKKRELRIVRCIVPATVESVNGKRVVLNLFNLDIVGICRQDNWNRKHQSLSLEQQVRIGDEVEVEVLYHVDPKIIKDPALNNGWVVSRRNVADTSDVNSFQKAIKDYPSGTTVQVVCERVLANTAGLNGFTRWVGHIKGTDIRVFARYGNRRIGISKGGVYAVVISNVNEERLQLEGKTVGYVYESGGAFVPQRKRNDNRLKESTPEDDAFAEEGFADVKAEKPIIEGFE